MKAKNNTFWFLHENHVLMTVAIRARSLNKLLSSALIQLSAIAREYVYVPGDDCVP